MSDDILLDLVRRAKADDAEAMEQILDFFYRYGRSLARVFANIIGGCDHQDCLQIFIMGVVQAVKSFKDNGGQSFRNFAYDCGEKKLITEKDASQRLKRRVNYNALSLSKSRSDDSSETVGDFFCRTSQSPEHIYFVRLEIREKLERLSHKELSVLVAFCAGYSIDEISEKLQFFNTESCDNAMTRVGQKTGWKRGHTKAMPARCKGIGVVRRMQMQSEKR